MKRFPTNSISVNASERSQSLLRDGMLASQSDESDRALLLFTEASEADPQDPMPLFLLGSEYASRGSFDRAESALAGAVLLAPHLHIARYQLGLLQFTTERTSLALLSWEPLYALDQELPFCHFVHGFAKLAADDLSGARDHFQRGLNVCHDNPALSADVHRVIAEMDRIQAPSAQANTGRLPISPSHVLVSNYGKFGSLH